MENSNIKTDNFENRQRNLFSKKSRLSKEGKEILDALKHIKGEMEQNKQNFDLAEDNRLIDSYIYEIIALNKKYEYFLDQAKKNGIVAEGFEKTS